MGDYPGEILMGVIINGDTRWWLPTSIGVLCLESQSVYNGDPITFFCVSQMIVSQNKGPPDTL